MEKTVITNLANLEKLLAGGQVMVLTNEYGDEIMEITIAGSPAPADVAEKVYDMWGDGMLTTYDENNGGWAAAYQH